MDDKLRFDQLEEIIVELLRKTDRTIADVGHLREAIAAQQLLLVQMQNDMNRSDERLTKLARVVNKGFQEIFIAHGRNERLLQETAAILAQHEIYHKENKVFQQDTREALTENRAFQQETRDALAATQNTVNKILDLLSKP